MVAKAPEQMALDQCRRGWAALDAGRWEQARACFERALAEGETPEAREGLSWAAWWLDDAGVVFDARARAYRLYGRAAIRRARHGWRRGWRATSSTSTGRCRWRAAGCGARSGCSSRWSRGRRTGGSRSTTAYHARVRGDAETAQRLAVRAGELGRRFGVADLEMLGLALEGATLVAGARVAEGMRRLDEAAVAALEGEAEIPMSGAWTFCFLVSACTAVLDYERAVEWCDRIRAVRRALRQPLHAGVLPGRVRGGAPVVRALGRRRVGARGLDRRLLGIAAGDGRGPVGRARGAEAAPGAAKQRRSRCSSGRGRRRRRSCAARGWRSTGARRGGRSSSSSGWLRRVSEQRRLDRAPALELLVRARVACGELEQAAAAVGELRELERLVGTSVAAGVRRSRRSRRGCRPERARPRSAAARGRRRRLRRRRRALRGRSREDRPCHGSDRARARRRGRARGGRRPAIVCSNSALSAEAERARTLAA